MKQKPLLKNPKISCYELTRQAHDCIKWLGGNVCDGHILRESQMNIENISRSDKAKISIKIELIREELYDIEKILVKYEM
jgi:hypothetical protein